MSSEDLLFYLSALPPEERMGWEWCSDELTTVPVGGYAIRRISSAAATADVWTRATITGSCSGVRVRRDARSCPTRCPKNPIPDYAMHPMLPTAVAADG